jgi:energy-coupling factor transporter ATP-binding protein EcfA2
MGGFSYDLSTLSFGALAAERDTGLRDYFFESESYKRVLSGAKSVIMGPRGSGKTALFKMVADHQKAQGSIVMELSPEEYSYELLSQTLHAEAQGSWAKQGAYAAAWKYLMYVLAMKKAMTAGSRVKTGPDKKIYEYLRDRHKGGADNPIGLLISYLKRLEGLKLGQYEASLKAKQLHQLYKLEEISELLDPLNEIAGRKGLVILVDELDRGWDASEDAIAFVAGLFQAAVSIADRTPNVRVLVSLRRELYENIPALYEDAQKVRDIVETVEWDEEQLLELITRRIGHSITGAQQLSSEEKWNLIFAGTLAYRRTKSFNYMVDRTLYRPRELIQFCTDVRDTAQQAGTDFPVDYDRISEAELSYSEARLKDISAEYRFQYPGLVSVFETFRGMTFALDRDDLEHHLIQISLEDIPVDEDAQKWCTEAEPDVLIDILWRVGFLRAQAVGGLKARRRSGSSYLGSHQVRNLNLRALKRFHVHPMFRAHLGMKEKKKST